MNSYETMCQRIHSREHHNQLAASSNAAATASTTSTTTPIKLTTDKIQQIMAFPDEEAEALQARRLQELFFCKQEEDLTVEGSSSSLSSSLSDHAAVQDGPTIWWIRNDYIKTLTPLCRQIQWHVLAKLGESLLDRTLSGVDVDICNAATLFVFVKGLIDMSSRSRSSLTLSSTTRRTSPT